MSLSVMSAQNTFSWLSARKHQPSCIWQDLQKAVCQLYPENQLNSLLGAPWTKHPGAVTKQRRAKTRPRGLKKVWV